MGQKCRQSPPPAPNSPSVSRGLLSPLDRGKSNGQVTSNNVSGYCFRNRFTLYEELRFCFICSLVVRSLACGPLSPKCREKIRADGQETKPLSFTVFAGVFRVRCVKLHRLDCTLVERVQFVFQTR